MMIDCLRCWGCEISQVLRDTNFGNACQNLKTVFESRVWANLHEKKYDEWQNNIYQLNKLRTYVLFKGNICLEAYVRFNVNRKQ